MARFPRTEPRIIELAEELCAGLARNVEDFPKPPYSASEMRTILSEYRTALAQLQDARAVTRRAQLAKNNVFARVWSVTKSNIKSVEATSRKNAAKLRAVGWGLPRPRTKLLPPGQVMYFRILEEGKDWVEFDWKVLEGGKVRLYEIQRRPEGRSEWEHAGSSTKTNVTLTRQPRGIALEYQARAMNKAGMGLESNVVRVVL